jgi:transposase
MPAHLQHENVQPGEGELVRLSRKNALFAGSAEGGKHWAAIASLIKICKLNGVDPQIYLADLLTHLVDGWPQSRIGELMPWHWSATT